MPSLKLSKILHRDPSKPTLRERAKALRSTIARLKRSKPGALPAPGSQEAMDAFGRACREDTHLSLRGLLDFPDLKRSQFEWWTRATIQQALNKGELTPAEGAALYARAAQRELIFERANVATNVGALNILAFAADYPDKAEPEDAPEAQGSAINPTLAAMVAELDGLRRTLKDGTLSDDEGDAEIERATILLQQVFKHPASSPADLFTKIAAHRDFDGPWWEADHTAVLDSLIADLERLAALPSATASCPPPVPSPPLACEAARIGRLIDVEIAKLNHLEAEGADEEGHPQHYRWTRAEDGIRELQRSIPHVRARSDGGILTQVVVAADLVSLLADASDAQHVADLAASARRCLYSIAACVSARSGIDRESHGASYTFSGKFDRLAETPAAEA